MGRAALVTAGALAVIAGAFWGGYATPRTTAHPNPIVLEHGVPVGVGHSSSGALAAADNYLAAEDSSLLSPGALRAVVDTDWTVRERQVELAQAVPAASLRTTPAELGDTKLTASVAAHKLESYAPSSARVGVWHELTVWSSTLAPTQYWSLDTVTLLWRDGRWLVSSRVTSPTTATPVPPWSGGSPDDRTSAAFDQRLAGMSAPYYGDGGAAR